MMTMFNEQHRTDNPRQRLETCDTIGKGLTHLLVRLKGWTYVPGPNRFELYDSQYETHKGTPMTVENKTHAGMYDNLVYRRDTWLYSRREKGIADYYAVWCPIPDQPTTWICATFKGADVRASDKTETQVGNCDIAEKQYTVPYHKIDRVFKLQIAGGKVTRWLYDGGFPHQKLVHQGEAPIADLMLELEVAQEFTRLIGEI